MKNKKEQYDIWFFFFSFLRLSYPIKNYIADYSLLSTFWRIISILKNISILFLAWFALFHWYVHTFYFNKSLFSNDDLNTYLQFYIYLSMAAFRFTHNAHKIYSICDLNHRFYAHHAWNGTQPNCTDDDQKLTETYTLYWI